MSPQRRALARSVQITSHGGVDMIDIVETERPVPGPGEVLVEVLAAGINHVEAYLRQGVYHGELDVHLPIGQGSDFAGLVSTVGAGVTSFAKGSEVIGHTSMASHATFIVVPASNLVKKPASLSWEVAGSLFLAGLAAEDAVESVGIGRGDVVVVSAAAGGVGSIEAHLAMAKGATVIGTCGERNFDYLRQIGVKVLVRQVREERPRRADLPRCCDGFADGEMRGM